MKITKSEMVILISGLIPTFDVMDDKDIKKCGYMGNYIFQEEKHWFWNKIVLKRQTIETLERIIRVIRGQEKENNNTNEPTPHRYVTLNGSALRLTQNGEYYRDGGCWGVNFKFLDGKFLSVSYMDELNNIELKPITKIEYEKDNRGYI